MTTDTIILLVLIVLALPGAAINAAYAWRWRRAALYEWYTSEMGRRDDEIAMLEAMLSDKARSIQSHQETIQFYQKDAVRKAGELTALQQRVARQEIEIRRRGGQVNSE